MSALGEYVHRSWLGYETGGTHRNPGVWVHTKNNPDSNYDLNIFNKYKNTIRARAELLQVTNLKAKETEYNARRQEEFSRLVALTATNPELKSLFTASILNAEVGKNINIQQAADMVDFNKKLETLKFDASASGGAKLRPIRDQGTGTSKTYIKTLTDQCTTALRAIELLEDKDMQELPRKQINSIKTNLESLQTTIEKERRIENEVMQLDNDIQIAVQGSLTKTGKAMINREAAIVISKRIAEIGNVVSLLSQTAKLQGSFEEVLGTAISNPVKRIAYEQILDAFTNGSILGSQTSTMQIGNAPIIKLDQDFMNGLLTGNEKSSWSKMLKNDAGEIKFEVEYDTKNKVDFELTFKDGDSLGISAKAQDLSREFDDFKDKSTPASIKLQEGTSLLAYLLAMNKMQDDLGNHFLNIFATHDQQNPKDYTTLRQSANEAFLAMLLYSSLSGDITKPHAKLASVLYVYDKRPGDQISRVKFFSVTDMIKDIMDQSWSQQIQNTSIAPISINDIRLINTYEGNSRQHYTAEEQDKLIRMRITKVLAQARAIRFKVGLTHSYLNSIYK